MFVCFFFFVCFCFCFLFCFVIVFVFVFFAKAINVLKVESFIGDKLYQQPTMVDYRMQLQKSFVVHALWKIWTAAVYSRAVTPASYITSHLQPLSGTSRLLKYTYNTNCFSFIISNNGLILQELTTITLQVNFAIRFISNFDIYTLLFFKTNLPDEKWKIKIQIRGFRQTLTSKFCFQQ